MAPLNVHELQHKGKTTAVKGNSDWKKVELVFENTQSGPLTINCPSVAGAGQGHRMVRRPSPCRKSNRSTSKADGQKEIKDHGPREGYSQTRRRLLRPLPQDDNEGGVIGPALDGIASRKDRAYLYESLVDPTAALAEGFDKLGASPMPLNEPAAQRPAARRRHGLPHDVEGK